MAWSEKIRRAFNVMLDGIKEIRLIMSEKERLKSDRFFRSHFERKIQDIGEGIARVKINDPLLKAFKDIRNDISHKFVLNHDDIIDTVNKNLNQLEIFAENYINTHFSNNQALRSFEKFGGVGMYADRARLIDALYDKFWEQDKNNRTKFPTANTFKPYSITIDEFTSHADLLKLVASNYAVGTQITEEIAVWAKETHKKIEVANPFSDEEKLLNDARRLSIRDFFGSYEQIRAAVAGFYPNNEINLTFFDKKIKGLDKSLDVNRVITGELKSATKGKYQEGMNVEEFLDSDIGKEYKKDIPFTKKNYNSYAKEKAEKSIQEAEVLQQNFLKDWDKLVFDKKHKYELEEIDKARAGFVEQLYKKIAEFNKLKELLEPFTKDLGRLWDLSGGVWQNSGFELLKQYAKVLENDKAIIQLSAMLGRYRKSQREFEEVEIEKVVIRPKFKPHHATKGEVVGIKESDDISSMLPIEAATLANPLTKGIFLKKYAEKKLATFDFKNQNAFEEIRKTERQIREKEDGKGPIIICVDTSGSMHGIPEQVAKTLCFALTKMALQENRKCFLISFSTKIETIELTDLQNSLDKLIDFLAMSFNGGTDANPALNKALEMLKTDEYQKADVLMVSDFIMEALNKQIVAKIDEAKGSKTRFHSLTISDTANHNVISQFDHNWVYNTKSDKSNTVLIQQLQKLAE